MGNSRFNIDIDWKYAITEILLIVVGISIALAANNWNQRRLDKNYEADFLKGLHEEVVMAEELSSRVRDRRFSLHELLGEIIDVVTQPHMERDLSQEECDAVGVVSFLTINLSELPSFSELAGSGRMSIISNPQLRVALVNLQQIRGSFPLLINQIKANDTPLFREFPELVRLSPYVDPTGEFRIEAECDTKAMRSNTKFKNLLIVNVDNYDVYVRDGLRPWFDQFESVHMMLDEDDRIQH